MNRRGSVDGRVFISGEFVCDCAEHAESCVPAGCYRVIIHKCKQYNRKMPLLIKTDGELPNCRRCTKIRGASINTRMPQRCPMLKPGNGVNKRCDGSIIVGERLCQGVMLQPATIFNRIIDRLDKAQNSGETIMLTI